jgi:hypothetical protein
MLVVMVGCSSGEPIGKVDAMKPSSFEADFAAGEKLRFRVDAEGLLGTPHESLARRDAIGFLQRSQVEISVKGPSGATTVRCPITGSGLVEGKSGAKLFATGTQVSCEVPIGQPGKHQVSATVLWDPAIIEPLSASVEVRRVKK